ncbi:MAG: ISNCY family transposase [Leptolyngbyaceae cyanobacterium SU_3_3]|nr:ISNCY family transposase [Leptolyngbyaceae cyanobacterium SU_3_3]
MESLPLSFAVLLNHLYGAVQQIADPRQPSNATRYKLGEVILGAFSVFFMQCESFLEHQRQMQSRRGKDNAQSLFGIGEIPSCAQIRNLLDEVAAVGLFEVFFQVYAALRRGRYLQPYEQVIALAPEFVTPQDGHDKQDCEVTAAKRWISAHADRLQPQPITLLGDDLYSHQPLCEPCLAHPLSFIFTGLSESHSALYDRLDYLDANGQVKTFEQVQWNKCTKEIYRYRYVNAVPLRDTQPALLVNGCELTLVRESDGKVLYFNAFVTDHDLTPETVPHVVGAGRSRWKTENENHNVLKTKGYHLEHNFGQGQHHLASSLLTLNLLAFLFHTVLHLVDDSYQQIRHKRGTRKGFFQDILALTQYLWFESWQHLLDFMLSDSPPAQTADSS